MARMQNQSRSADKVRLITKAVSSNILTSLSVNSVGQNSRSSSRSKDLPASNSLRKKVTLCGGSAISFMLRTPRNVFLWLFCEVDNRGARRDLPWWEAACAVEGTGL